MSDQLAPADRVKLDGRFLRGSIAAGLEDPSPRFSDQDVQLLKFHGIYQQDDRDLRNTAGHGDREWIFMVRAAIPGGRLRPHQYLVMDRLADEVGNGTLRITSRQGIQWHHTRKGGLRPLLATLNRHLVTTLGACGDVVRNTMFCPAPLPGREAVARHVEEMARHFRPRTRAYYEIWIDGEKAVTAEAPVDHEPVYGPTYLPRKFKIAFAFPGDNCTDIYGNDIGIVPLFRDRRPDRFVLMVGGGMGKSHGRPDTFPRLADPFATVSADDLLAVVEAIVGIQRDFGERHDRKHARLKYLVEYWGLDDFRRAVERRLGHRLASAEPVDWETSEDHVGWHAQPDGRWFYGLPIENGRISDTPQVALRSGIRAVVERLGVGIHLTPSQSLLLVDVPVDRRREVETVLGGHGIPTPEAVPVVIRRSMACVALPTCGLALTDAERALPRVIRRLHQALDQLGLADDAPTVRMSGCPNGCSRPYNAEIGLVGRRAGRYDVHVGGSHLGTRLNSVLAENVPEEELVEVLVPALTRWRDHRLPGERFGDFWSRDRR
jgi:sulfite reductase (ferredoxin)